MRQFIQQVTLMGKVFQINDDGADFGITCRSGDDFYVYANSPELKYYNVRNLDEQTSERFNPKEEQITLEGRQNRVSSLLSLGQLVVVEGTLFMNQLKRRVDASTVYILNVQPQVPSPMVFETNNWWVNQIRSLGDRWLLAQFGSNTSQSFDFANYRTYLDFTFKPINDLQETATLSRLIYGFASSYLLTGNERFLLAAQSGIQYQREHFRQLRGDCIFWAYGKHANQTAQIFPSTNPDDDGTIALYEQIYAIAGLTQYYRITQDPQVFSDIRGTVLSFIRYFKDNTQFGGFFSHINPDDLRYDSQYLGDNQSKKNWNSVGDHIPAYLINLLIVLEPLVQQRQQYQKQQKQQPQQQGQQQYWSEDQLLSEFLVQCQTILRETSRLIVEKFPERNPQTGAFTSPYVNERFDQQWQPDQKYRWQQNRGIVGHNLKIAWNLTRVAHYYESKGENCDEMNRVAEYLAQSMVDVGAVDVFRGGCYDAVERNPSDETNMGRTLQFAWLPTKDFWQQEQAILAYLILHGKTQDQQKKQLYLELAQETAAFWNISFLDHDNGGVYFRTNQNGEPVVKGDYSHKGGHPISGYHAFELCYLAHVYTCAYVTGEPLTLYFRPSVQQQQALSVLPDFLPLKSVRLDSVYVNGVVRQLTTAEQQGFYVNLRPEDNQARIEVRLGFATESYVNRQLRQQQVVQQTIQPSVQQSFQKLSVQPVVQQQVQPRRGKIGLIVESHYDETEIRVFRDYFPQNGYEVEYLSYVWPNAPNAPPKQYEEYSGNDNNDPLRVRASNSIDLLVGDKLKEYAGFILIGGYCQDRLRYEQFPQKGKQNQSPPVQFLRRVLSSGTNIKIGTICHSAWLFTVDPALLKTANNVPRKLTCSHNVIYDVLNAGGQVVYDETSPQNGTVNVCVDGNLVTGKHPGVCDEFAKTFVDELNKSYPIAAGF